jgi:hypothetical protein
VKWLETLAGAPIIYDLLLLVAPRPNFIVVPLGAPAFEVGKYFPNIKPEPHAPEREDTEEINYSVGSVHYLITTYQGTVHGVNIKSPVSPWQFVRTKKVFSTLRQYRNGSEWVPFRSDGFGSEWHRKSDQARALYSSTFGIISFHTPEFFALPRNLTK